MFRLDHAAKRAANREAHIAHPHPVATPLSTSRSPGTAWSTKLGWVSLRARSSASADGWASARRVPFAPERAPGAGVASRADARWPACSSGSPAWWRSPRPRSPPPARPRSEPASRCWRPSCTGSRSTLPRPCRRATARSRSSSGRSWLLSCSSHPSGWRACRAPTLRGRACSPRPLWVASARVRLRRLRRARRTGRIDTGVRDDLFPADRRGRPRRAGTRCGDHRRVAGRDGTRGDRCVPGESSQRSPSHEGLSRRAAKPMLPWCQVGWTTPKTIRWSASCRRA